MTGTELSKSPSLASLVEIPIHSFGPDCPPGALLRADYDCAVPFHGRHDEITGLLKWTSNAGSPRVRLYSGAGGMGKTRLALELGLRLKRAGWEAGFLTPVTDASNIADQIPADRHVLAIIDYAETRRSDILALVSAALSRQSQTDKTCRVILLAREAGDWWRELKGDYGVGTLLAEEPTFSVGPLAPTKKDREIAFHTALHHFAAILGKAAPTDAMPEDADSEAYEHILLLQMAALARIEGISATGQQSILDFVLERERKFWGRLAADRGLPETIMPAVEQAMGAITLGGGCAQEGEALELIGDVPAIKRFPGAAADVASMLHRAYPGRNFIEPLLPDLLGEHLAQQVYDGPLLAVILKTLRRQKQLRRSVAETESRYQAALADTNRKLADSRQEIQKLKESIFDQLWDKRLERQTVTDQEMTVFFLDLVGFSTMPIEQQRTKVQTIRDFATTLGQQHHYHAQYSKTWGDAVCAVFEDVNKGLDFAPQLIGQLHQRGIDVRIGMSYGAVRIAYDNVAERPDINGSVVSEAARLEPLAYPGQVLVSSSLRDRPEVDTGRFAFTVASRQLKKAVANSKAGDVVDCYSVAYSRY
jgi:class 3 adenylate cyclase